MSLFLYSNVFKAELMLKCDSAAKPFYQYSHSFIILLPSRGMQRLLCFVLSQISASQNIRSVLFLKNNQFNHTDQEEKKHNSQIATK